MTSLNDVAGRAAASSGDTTLVDPERLQAALAAMGRVIGSEHIITGDAAKLEFGDPYSPRTWDRFQTMHAVQPATVEEVQAIVRIAAEYGIPLWTNSQGRNNGYGGSTSRLPGAILVNLRRMNRVLEVNDEFSYVVVEPGVSYNELYEYTRAHGHDLWIDVPDLGWGSVVGNALDHGGGYTIYGDHPAAACGMEIVLANGEILRTGMGGLPGAETWHIHKRGFGPSLESLFMQSNFGIVTKMGFWAMPQPEKYVAGHLQIDREEDMPALIDALRPLIIDRTIPNLPYMLNARAVATSSGTRHELAGPDGTIPDDRIADFRRVTGLGAWIMRFALYGREARVNDDLAAIKAAIAHLPGARVDVTIYDGDDPAIAESPIPDTKVQAGVPDMTLLQVLNFAGAKRAGHVCLSSIAALRGADAQKIIDLVRPEIDAAGIHLSSAIMLLQRSLVHVALLVYDADDENEVAKVYDLCHRLIPRLAELGYAEYRAHPDFMDDVANQFSYNDHAIMRVNEAIKDALDPAGILAPGKSGIWPAALRGKSIDLRD